MKTAKEYLLKRDHLLYNILQPYPKEGFIHIFIDSQIQWNKKTWCSIMSSKHHQASADWIFTNLRKHCRNRCRSQSLHCTAVFIAVLFILVWFDSHINPLLFIIFSHFLLSELFLIWTDYVQAVRGLLMCGLTIGFFAVVCCFVGMECTYIGGSDKTKDKVLFAGAVLHFVGGKLWTYAVLLSVNVLPSFFFLCSPKPLHAGMSDIAAYCLYINRIARTAFARKVASGVLRYCFFHSIHHFT